MTVCGRCGQTYWHGATRPTGRPRAPSANPDPRLADTAFVPMTILLYYYGALLTAYALYEVAASLGDD